MTREAAAPVDGAEGGGVLVGQRTGEGSACVQSQRIWLAVLVASRATYEDVAGNVAEEVCRSGSFKTSSPTCLVRCLRKNYKPHKARACATALAALAAMS